MVVSGSHVASSRRGAAAPAAMTAADVTPAEVVPVLLAADVAAFTAHDGALGLLLVRRTFEPFAGQWALPGGFVRVDETTDRAALRELAEETGVALERVHVEQLATYSDPDRDPRGRVVSVAHVAFVPGPLATVAGSDAAEARVWPVSAIDLGVRGARGALPLAFDHRLIARDAIERVRAKLEYTTLATRFVPGTFTMSELRQVYEAVWGVSVDPANFSKKVLSCEGFVHLVASGRSTGRQVGRPARRYRSATAAITYLRRPLLRPEA